MEGDRTMFSVFIAEDEPASMDFIKNIVSQKCPEFYVVGEAYDGAEALEKLLENPADVLISDVEMDDVNGIELITKLASIHPQTHSIVVSGYSDFAYTQGALRAKAVDYILKPINIQQLVERLDKIAEKLRKDYRENQLYILHSCISKNLVDKKAVDYYFNSELFSLTLIHKGGHEDAGGIEMMGREVLFTNNYKDCWILSGRNSSELLVISESENCMERIEQIIDGFSDGNYCTTVFSDLCKIEDVNKTAKLIASQLDECLTIGKTQTVKLGVQENVLIPNTTAITATPHAKVLDCHEFLSMSDFYLQNGDIKGFEDELVRNFRLWEDGEYNAVQVGRALDLLFSRISRHQSTRRYYNYSNPLALALLNATTMEELMAMVLGIFNDMLELKTHTRQSTEAHFDVIDEYISRHYMEALSLQGVCNRFYISQTYLSRLFRKHRGMSFNDYLTILRIERAKEIIAKNKSIKLKDVAQMVGYPDSSYFSKVFRLHVGCAPSQYSP